MSEARRAVLAFTRREIAKALVAAFSIGALPHAAKALFRGPRGGSAGGSSGVLSTFTFVNDSSSPTSVGTPTQTFGLLFKQGDVPSGSVPVLTANGVTQPYSAGVLSQAGIPGAYWPDGSLKHVTIMLMPTFSVAGNSSQAIEVSVATGSWPATSGRTLSADVYPQQMVAGAVPYAGQTRTAALYGAVASDGNNLRASKWLDGAAGTGWRITTNMTTTIGSTADADGQLAVDHYVIALNNVSGSQGGFRYLPVLRQPWYNSTSEQALTSVFFAPPSTKAPTTGVWWQYGSEPTATALTWPYSASEFTALDGNLTTNSANDWYNGTGNTGGTLPIAVTGDALPAPLTNGQLLFAGNLQGTTAFTPCTAANSDGPGNISITGTGSGTATPVVCINPFTRIPMATPQARYNFFQGSGSIAVETTLRATIDRTYWAQNPYFPFDYPTYQGSTEDGAITDINWPYDWDPYSIFDQDPDQEEGSGGDAPAIGIVPNIASIDFFNQSLIDDVWIRGFGLGYCLQAYDFKDVSSLNAPQFDNPANSYTGLPSANSATLNWNANGGGAGFSVPAFPYGTPLVWQESAAAHQPNYATWAYLRTGDLLFIDLMRDNVAHQILYYPQFNNPTTDSGAPYDAYSIMNFFGLVPGEYRNYAWAQRSFENVASFYPGNPNDASALDCDGTQTYLYVKTLADNNCDFPVDVFNFAGSYNGNSAVQTYIQNRGQWEPSCSQYFNGEYTGFASTSEDQPWEFGMMMQVMAWGALRGNAKAIEFLILAAQRWNYVLNTYGGWTLYAYFTSIGIPFTDVNNTSNPASQLIDADNQFGAAADPNLFIGWIANAPDGTPAFFTATPSTDGIWEPANGDIFIINQSADPPNEAPSVITGLLNVYEVQNWTPSGTQMGSFDLVPVGGDSRIVPTDSNAGTGPNRLGFYTWSKSNFATECNGFFDYIYQMRAQCVFAKAALAQASPGDSTIFDAIIADADYRLANSQGGPYPLYQTQPVEVGELVDARYVVTA